MTEATPGGRCRPDRRRPRELFDATVALLRGLLGPAARLVLPAAGQRRPAAGDRPDHGLLGDQRRAVRRPAATPSPRSSEQAHLRRASAWSAFWVCQRLPVRTYRALARPGADRSRSCCSALLDVLRCWPTLKVLERPDARPARAPTSSGSTSARCSCSRPSWPSSALVALGRRRARPQGRARSAHWRELARPLFPVAGLLFVLVGYNDLGTMLCLVILFVGHALGGRRAAAGLRRRCSASRLLGIVGADRRCRASQLPARTGSTRSADPTSCTQHGDRATRPGRACSRSPTAAGSASGWARAALKWGWLPNGHNDFIFAVIAEELGVVGCLVVLALFAVLAYTGLRIARRVQRPVPPAGRGRRSPRLVAGRPSSTSAAWSACCRSPACRCRSSPTAAARWS